MLMTHYREPIDFSVRKLEEAERLLEKFARRAGDADDGQTPDTAVIEALSDDLNFSAALASLSGLEGTALASSMAMLGFSTYRQAKTIDVDEAAIAERIAARLDFIRQKDWASADAIRDELAADGIQLKDGKDPDTGDRVTTWEAL